MKFGKNLLLTLASLPISLPGSATAGVGSHSNNPCTCSVTVYMPGGGYIAEYDNCPGEATSLVAPPPDTNVTSVLPLQGAPGDCPVTSINYVNGPFPPDQLPPPPPGPLQPIEDKPFLV